MVLATLFQDPVWVARIQSRLPALIALSEQESSRGGRLGMEVGSARERVLIALLICAFGKENVTTDIDIRAAEIDALVHGVGVSIKSISNRNLIGFKLSWTVDQANSHSFIEHYMPECEMIVAQICWGRQGWLYLFPIEAQVDVLQRIGRSAYMSAPREGTNPRGVSMTTASARAVAAHPASMAIPIHWLRTPIEFDAYQRWVDLWQAVEGETSTSKEEKDSDE